MKKLSLVAIAAVLAAPTFADPVGGGINASISSGVNVGSVTNLGINNVGVVNQNVGLGGGALVAPHAFDQDRTDFNMQTHAFSVGSIVDSGNGGNGGRVNVVAVSAAIAASGNRADDQGGLAGGLAVPVALAGLGGDEAEAGARVASVQANLSSQRSASLAGSSQRGIGNGIEANGGDGKAFMITIGSNNTRIDNTSVSKIEVDSTINIAERGGVAGGLKVDDSFNPVKIDDSLNGNAVALDQGDAVAANGNRLGIFGF
jgi:hypothetical protein